MTKSKGARAKTFRGGMERFHKKNVPVPVVHTISKHTVFLCERHRQRQDQTLSVGWDLYVLYRSDVSHSKIGSIKITNDRTSEGLF